MGDLCVHVHGSGVRTPVLVTYSFCCIIIIISIHCPCVADTQTPKNPLWGSRQRWPSNRGTDFVYHGKRDLTRLLDVGACGQYYDPSISFVPPLDGASPYDTLCQDNYAMQFVFFDLQLVQLKSVDAVGGTFRVQFQMVLHWVDAMVNGSNGTDASDQCSFACDTTSPTPTCCDDVWVPPLQLSGCDINNIDSSTPTPYIFYLSSDHISNANDCFANAGQCMWRRLWYLNIDATCMSHMDFHNFPFDLQELSIDILNPYASRTWFQLTTGFLKKHINEDINGVNLSPGSLFIISGLLLTFSVFSFLLFPLAAPLLGFINVDAQIPGWYIKDLKVSGTCGTSQTTWLQTFLAQDALLSALSSTDGSMPKYESQRPHIEHALDPKNLACAPMQDFNVSKDDENLLSPTNWYKVLASEAYDERVRFALDNYRQCIEAHGKDFSWNTSVLQKDRAYIPEFGFFSTSDENIERSFSFVNLDKDLKVDKVWFPCAIAAITNLTSPGIRVTILVQRYRMFYVVKLILPTIACVIFTFSAFGIEPEELLGRLSLVVPSVIALTTLQGLAVATDIPPVAYMAPSTYIILVSYMAQLLIASESIAVNWWLAHKKPKVLTMSHQRASLKKKGAHTMHATSREPFHHLQEAESKEQGGFMITTRKFDLFYMGLLVLLYGMAIVLCTVRPWQRSERDKGKTLLGSTTIWKSL